MNENELKKKIRNISRWKRGNMRAPHKPLLLLYTLVKYSKGHKQLFSFEHEIDKVLVDLLKRFGPPRKSYSSTYPFWRLVNDNFWKLTNIDLVIPRVSNTDPPKSELIKHNVEGGFDDDAYNLIVNNHKLINELLLIILVDCFPESISEQILDYMGYERFEFFKSRDPKFRIEVLRAYSYKCAVCKIDIRIDDLSICLDAAHIRWKQYGGPCLVDNGICLCSLHHRAFDIGAISIDDDYNVILSSSINGGELANDLFFKFDGVQILMPRNKLFHPAIPYLQWHRKEVFRP